MKRCESIDPIPTAVAHPCEASALAGAIEAGEKKLITPILVGPADKIQQTAAAAGIPAWLSRLRAPGGPAGAA